MNTELLQKYVTLGFNSEDITKKAEELKKFFVDKGIGAKLTEPEKVDKLINGLVEKRLDTWAKSMKRSKSVTLKAVVLGMTELENTVDNPYEYSIKRDGETRPKADDKTGANIPGTSYTVKAGYYPWGREQGKVIELDKDGTAKAIYSGSLLLAIENGDSVIVQRMFMNRVPKIKEIMETAGVGDVIEFFGAPSADGNKFYWDNLSTYKVLEKLSYDKLEEYVNKTLGNKVITVAGLIEYFEDADASDRKRGFDGLLVGNISDVYIGDYGNSFNATDTSVESTESGLAEYIRCNTARPIEFIVDALDVGIYGKFSLKRIKDKETGEYSYKKFIECDVLATYVPEWAKKGESVETDLGDFGDFSDEDLAPVEKQPEAKTEKVEAENVVTMLDELEEDF